MRDIQAPRIFGLIAATSLVLTTPLSMENDGLPDRVATLETEVASLNERLAAFARPMVVEVDCGAGGTIQAALSGSLPHPAPVTIAVYGVCSENVIVRRSQVTIRGAAPGAGITAANPTRQVVRTESPENVSLVLQDLTIAGGTDGVSVDFDTHVALSGCVVRNNTTGVRVDRQGGVALADTVLENNTFAGVAAMNGSHVSITGGVIQDNSGDGLALETGAIATVGGSAAIASNGRYGVSASNGALLSLNDAMITDSAITGIFVSGGSIVVLGKGATITANLGSGISLMDTSLVHKHRAEADIHITNNNSFGVVCSVSPAVSQIIGFTFQTGDISGNTLGDINCRISPGPLSQ